MNYGPEVSLRQIVSSRPLFVTRWWGFRPDRWASACFSSERVVDKWIGRCPNGGFLLGFASHHHQEQVAEADRGRVFGVYEFAPEKVFYEDATVIHPDYLNDPVLRRENGEFRWPWGLRAIRAWEFVRRVMTGGTLPTARSLSYEATTDMVPISSADFELANQHLLREVPVFNRPFNPLILRRPNAQPDQNYLLVCRDARTLSRMPNWRPGEVLYKPGIASNFESRCEFLNSHALARLFGLALTIEWSEPAESPDAAAEREGRMIEGAIQLGCRVAAEGQREFLFGSPRLFSQIVLIGRRRN